LNQKHFAMKKLLICLLLPLLAFMSGQALQAQRPCSDSMAIRRLSFFRLSKDKVRQLGEISKDDGRTWIREYDLEYRRRKTD
jgi:hypothetical protein